MSDTQLAVMIAVPILFNGAGFAMLLSRLNRGCDRIERRIDETVEGVRLALRRR